MQYSKLFGKSVKETTRSSGNVSSDLLYRAGFIRESVAGRYFLLPLGYKVHDKIIRIVREEMDKSGAQEMVAPVLHPLELWKETNRTNTTGFELMRIDDRRGAQFALGGTAEEMFVDVVRKFQLSYKDLPFNIYQFSSKFRDELRARGGLLRVREFTMKDAYSFNKNEDDFGVEYEKMKQTYTRIFKRLGLETYVVEADNGYIGGEYCHEFVVESEVGESRFFVTNDGSYCAHEDVAKFKRNPAGAGEEMKNMEVIDQPEWVRNMDEFEKHYKVSRAKCLKNVVYKNRVSGEIVIATLTGDLEVNKTKLEHVLNAVGQIEDATEEDLAKLGTKRGYVHSWGHKAKYVGDVVLPLTRNLIGGQKEELTDTFNVNYGRDFECDLIADIAMASDGDVSESGEKLVEKRGIEVGNIFQLGYHYTKLMKGAEYTDVDGKKKPYYMGCYGIGIGRTMASVVEKYHDQKGMVWPGSLAPYEVHLVELNSQETRNKAQTIYDKLTKAGVEVLWDDREDVSAGAKFADADLIGCPVRLVVSNKTNGKIEWKERASDKVELVNLAEVIKRLAHDMM